MKSDLSSRIIHPFPPILDSECKVLILGSFPSVLSRENDFYYGNPRNRFWTLMERLLSESIVEVSNEEKKQILLKHHIAVYDVVYSCRIHGSDDGTITEVVCADIPGLMDNTQITRIYCNGRKAYSLLKKRYPELMERTEVLPSTSPANAAWSMDKLIAEWKQIEKGELE